MQQATDRYQILEVGFYSNGWMTIFIPKRRGSASLKHEEFVANISGVKRFFDMRSGPHAPGIHNKERQYWAIPPEYVEQYSDETIVQALKDIWARQGVHAVIEVVYLDRPFTEAGELS